MQSSGGSIVSSLLKCQFIYKCAINGQRYVAFGVKDSLSEILKMCQDIFTLSTENYKKSLA